MNVAQKYLAILRRTALTQLDLISAIVKQVILEMVLLVTILMNVCKPLVITIHIVTIYLVHLTALVIVDSLKGE